MTDPINFINEQYLNSNFDFSIDYMQKEKAIAYIETDCSSGSGFMFTSNGLCFTCAHVVKNSSSIYVRLKTNETIVSIYKANVLFQNDSLDFAILLLENCDNNYFFVLETEFSNIKSGDDIAVFGFPFGTDLNKDIRTLEPSLTKGYIASKNKINEQICYYLDVRSAPGNSGGPIFSKNQKVFGYLCGSYGTDRSNLVYMRTLESFLIMLKDNYRANRKHTKLTPEIALKYETIIANKLMPREEKILKMLLGLSGDDPMSPLEISRIYNVCVNRVYQVEAKFLRILRHQK